MQDIKVYEDKMNKTLDNLQGEYGTIRAGRANPHVLDKIKVDYYGTPTPIQQVGNISVPEARMIVIQPWEKSLLKAIEKAILTSDLGRSRPRRHHQSDEHGLHHRQGGEHEAGYRLAERDDALGSESRNPRQPRFAP